MENYCVDILPDSVSLCPLPTALVAQAFMDSLLFDWQVATPVDSFELQLTDLTNNVTEVYFSQSPLLAVGQRPGVPPTSKYGAAVAVV